jgi:Rad3-related DNA helicase
MTSATLKIGDNFNYLKNILSLKDETFNFFTYSQEFDYKKQATLIIPNDL